MRWILLAVLFAADYANAETTIVDTSIVENCSEMSCIGSASNKCQTADGRNHTTLDMMQCNMAEAAEWDKRLNEVYQRAMADARQRDATAPTEHAHKAQYLLAAQRAWITYRDANCDLAYYWYSLGSMKQITGSLCRLRMTARRAIELENYTNRDR